MFRFLGHQFTKAEMQLVEQESRLEAIPVSTWTINLSVLWASPDITPCDMHQLSHVLADEIYNRVEARDQLNHAWQEEEEMEEEKEENDAVEILINDLKEYGSSEENSNEEYDEEEINDLIENILGEDVDEEEYMNDYEEEEEEYMNDYEDMGDYDYLADVNGEYDELAMELEADDVNDPDAAITLEKDLGSDLDAEIQKYYMADNNSAGGDDDSKKADDVNDHDTEDH